MHFSQFVEDEGGPTSYGLCSSCITDHLWRGRRKKTRTYVLLSSLPKSILNNLKKKRNNVVCATSKASDQPAHTQSLVSAFASRLNIL